MPKLDGVTLRIIPESAARIAALESGAVDIVWSMPYESVDKFKNHPTVRTDSVSTPTWDGVILNNDRPPFNDVRVRQALALTIDKAAIVELALFGQGEPTFSPIPPSHPYFNKSLKFNPPDIAKAKKLLAEAGYPERLRRADAGAAGTRAARARRRRGARHGAGRRHPHQCRARAVRLLHGECRRQGADVCRRLLRAPDDRYRDLSVLSFAPEAGTNSSGSTRMRASTRLLDDARKTNDEAARKAIFEKFQAVVDETVPGIIAYSAAHVNGVSKKVEGFHSTPMQWLEFKGVSLKP